MNRRIVSTGELEKLLRAHANDPSPTGLRYYEIQREVTLRFWESLGEHDRAYYVPVEDTLTLDPVSMGEENAGKGAVYYTRYTLPPGSYDAWVVET